MASASGVTQINATYLNGLKQTLTDLETQVEQQITGLGTAGATSSTLAFVPAVTSTSLKVQAGTASFDAGATLNSALSTMGGSVADQLTWLQHILQDMINEITTTVSSFHGTESLNNESVDKLMSDFQTTIGDFNNPAGSSSSSTPGSTSSSTPPA